jgi:hypothetical protein
MDDLDPVPEPFPDLEALSDAELKQLVERKIAEEHDISRRRRLLHGQLDLLRHARVERLRLRYEDEAASLQRDPQA